MMDIEVCTTCGNDMDFEECPTCYGDGEVDFSQYDPSLMPGIMEQCDTCNGSGMVLYCPYCEERELEDDTL